MVEKALATLNAIFFGKKQKYLSTYCAQKKLVLKDWKKVLQCLCFGKYLITSLKFLYCVSSFGQFLSFSFNNGFLQQIYVKRHLTSIRCQDSNSQPVNHVSPFITPKPGGLSPESFYVQQITKIISSLSNWHLPKWLINQF